MEYDFDVIVVGGGAGGGTLAAACAHGHSVLLLERGRDIVPNGQASSEDAALIRREPYDDRGIKLEETRHRLYMGGVLGGGTSVYGGALLRPAEDDFRPGRRYPGRVPREVWDWPIAYEDLEPWYERAERLYHVAADPSDTMDPLKPVAQRSAASLLPLAAINRRMMESCRREKLNPFRLPLAIRSSACLNCDQCAGFPCPTGARMSSAQLVRDSIQAGHPLTVKTASEVDRIDRCCRHTIRGVRVRDRETGKTSSYRAKRYVLSAGAIGSPAILLRSGFTGSLIGRNYMMHYSPIAVGIFARKTGAGTTFVKQIGFADCYFGTREIPLKMGIIQSLPAPGVLMLQKMGMKLVPGPVLRIVRDRMLPLVGIVEDLPDPSNRVTVADNGGVRLRHQFSEFDRHRGEGLTKVMRRILQLTGAVHCVTRNFPSREHVAHQCGTLRFGNDRRTAVVDRDCRLFGQTELFVVDGSILPTSMGVGPALTIIANALRIADVLNREL